MRDNRTPNVTCFHCGSPFYKRPGHISQYPKHFCSMSCYRKSSNHVIDNGDGTATVPLTRGKAAVIDSSDIEIVSRYSWHASAGPDRFYAVTRLPETRRTEYLARLIMRPDAGQHVDHISGDTLDNRRANLRVCTQAENNLNKRRKAKCAAGFKGVRNESDNSWSARITKSGVCHHLGSFSTPEGAARAYDAAATGLHGEFARLNFPDG